MYIHDENPVNMTDPIWKCFGYGQLWPLWPACSQNWARSYMLDLTACIQFGSIFPKKAPDRTVQDRPRSDLDLSGFFGLYVSTFRLV